MPTLAKYGAQKTFYFALVDPNSSDSDWLTATPTLAAGDATIIKDGGASASTTNTIVWEGDGWVSITLTATEMQAAKILLRLRDQTATREWVTTGDVIQTGGHANADLNGT